MTTTFDNFKLNIDICRAYESDGKWLFEGVASSTAVDSHDTIMSLGCQEGFAFDINRANETDEPIELEAEHLGDELPMNVVGTVEFAKIDEQGRLHVRAELDKDNPGAVYYWNKMTKPNPKTGKVKKFGLSIHGNAEEAGWEYVESLGRSVQVFKRVRLKRIGIVRKPSNPESWITKMLRSVNWDDLKTGEVKRSESLERGLFVSVESNNKGDEVQKSETELKLELVDKIARGEGIFVKDVAANLQDWLLSLVANLSQIPKGSQEEALHDMIEGAEMIHQQPGSWEEQEKMEEEMDERAADTSNMPAHEGLSDEPTLVTTWSVDDLYRMCGDKQVRVTFEDDTEMLMGPKAILDACREWVKLSKTMGMNRSEDNQVEDQDQVVTVNDIGSETEPTGDVKEVRSEVEVEVEVKPEGEESEDAELPEGEETPDGEVERTAEEAQSEVTEEVVRGEAEVEAKVDDLQIVELLRSAVIESLKPQFEAQTETINQLRGQVEKLVAENGNLAAKNEELVERVAVVENKPAKAPGFVLGAVGDESIVRSSDSNLSDDQKREISRSRAKEAGDKDELLKLKLRPGYLGKDFN